MCNVVIQSYSGTCNEFINSVIMVIGGNRGENFDRSNHADCTAGYQLLLSETCVHFCNFSQHFACVKTTKTKNKQTSLKAISSRF